ncbi:MAG: class II glutamine amidotransferase [Cytophagales bacterium]|nr:class II glutamine amidotransferase [Armatimonadota bacterium]
MCRMIGMALSPVVAGAENAADAESASAASASLPSWDYLVGAPNSLRAQSATGRVPPGEAPGHEDSWGIGWFDAAGQVSLLRQTGSAADSAFFVFASEGAARTQAGSGPARTLIGHLRKASCGAVTSENAHPVRADYQRSGSARPYDSILVAHNGTLREPLLKLLRADLRDADREEASSDSDTVVLAGWLAFCLSRAGSTDTVFETMTKALGDLFTRADRAAEGDRTRVYSGVNLLVSHPSGLFALRQFSRNEDYYSLFARPLEPREGTRGGWAVASEPTESFEEWTPLAPGILTFYPVTGADPSARTAQVAVN